jgi:hypothetical protein
MTPEKPTTAEVLYLNEKEEELKKKILHYYRFHEDTFLSLLIKGADTGNLIKIALIDSRVDEVCKLPQFAEYWADIWRLCGLNPQEYAKKNNKPLHENLPIPTASSCFDLVKSYFLYEAYRKLIEKSDFSPMQKLALVEGYLIPSAELGCYFAINELCNLGVNVLKEQFSETIVTKLLHYAKLAAKIHLAPGYLLLANVYQELTQFQEQPILRTLNLRIEAFKAINVAKRLEELSAPMINNSFQGKKLAEASGGKLSSFSQAEQRLQGLLNLSYMELSLALEQGKEDAKAIRKLYSVNPLDEAKDSSQNQLML